MPLLDHFHPPLSTRRHWQAFLSRWASAIADAINAEGLPAQYFAEPTVQIGGQIEVDVATLSDEVDSFANGVGVVETLPKAAKVRTPDAVVPLVFPDTFEIQLIHNDGGPRLRAAIELISPANKDRPQSRRAFVIKCASYLQQGIGLIIIDIVTSRQFNLHNELMALLELGDIDQLADVSTYSTAYRPVVRESREEMDVWHSNIVLDQALPRLPLYVDVDLPVMIDFEASYQETRDKLRLGT